MTQKTLNKLVKKVYKTFKSKVTVWGMLDDIYIECKGFTGPSKKVEKLIADLKLSIREQFWSNGSDYTGYYYFVEE